MAECMLVPIDFSDITDDVLAEASQLATVFGAKIWLIHVAQARPDFIGYEVGPVYIREHVARQLHSEHRTLGAYQSRLAEQGLNVTAMLVPGRPQEKILQEAKRLNARWIVLGSHGHGALYHLLMGSVCESVLKKAPCTVIVVPKSNLGKTEHHEKVPVGAATD